MQMQVTNDSSESGTRVIHVIQGTFEVSDRHDDVMTTILGSCVCTGLCDPVRGVGGINHFLLPDSGSGGGGQLKYGLHAMELLINALLKLGADRSRLQAKLFGGARMHQGLGTIGQSNSEFALQFLRTEGIPCISQSLGGTAARRIRYWPTTGRAQQMSLAGSEPLVEVAPRPKPRDTNEITFF